MVVSSWGGGAAKAPRLLVFSLVCFVARQLKGARGSGL